MPSITGWTKLEPRPRDPRASASAEARIHDPLWLLTRQWQLGEWRASDAGSPMEAEIAFNVHTPTTLCDASGGTGAYDASVPLEAVALAEPTHLTLLRAAAAGSHLCRLLGRAGLERRVPAFVRTFPLPTSAASNPTWTLLCRRVPDGAAAAVDLSTALADGDAAWTARALALTEGDETLVAGLREIVETYIAWWASSQDSAPRNSFWNADRLEYGLALETAAGAEGPRFVAAAHPGGALDWPAFDVERPAGGGAGGTRRLVRAIPTPITFRGMSPRRFWQRGDESFDPGLVEAGPTDIARLLAVDLAIAYGSEFFVVPVVASVGTALATETVHVTDVFGVRVRIDAAPIAASRMFVLSERGPGAGAGPGPVFVPASAASPLEGEPLEEFLLLRDEMANMAWAIERIAPDPLGRSVRRADHAVDRAAAIPPSTLPADTATPYRLMARPPSWWFPLVPVATGPRAIRLQRWLARDPIRDVEEAPRGELLRRIEELNEETVTREGVRVLRSAWRAHGSDGRSFTWVANRRTTGRGEGTSGLQFDRTGEPPPP
jgi:hypothetical protein